MDWIVVTGVCASMCTALSLLPQLIKVLRTKKAEDVSYLMLAVLFTGGILWIVYGVMREDWIIIGSNTISVLINIISCWASIKYRPKDKMIKELM
ncbi:SemiSWEET family sugar transporter [Cytophaga hutchinsonii]|uniref:MtN3 and saliva related transmembrane protein n=1 Tax=Cytophaga hutchinsonii (strain ATCC 33406 / DSM 1761 / CIP 103989 / NBRC 15051 / NCIMB 9469 / D465) TaxID=269798 RepID=A0A6N4SQC0_CYTH3|nr:SemiSWEET transporter [Cytophaga hutchinsonii]ABG58516.1 conserved hypothetical protein [Cytophaga hutchinsonii ATCC 33406]SFX76087.1 MtN3 and saliva related transmembrane protein [Cytophaga hutchinsonii ATCC 33406]